MSYVPVINVCRLCLKNDKIMFNIFTSDEGNIKFNEIIERLCKIPVKTDDSFPKTICTNCKQILIGIGDYIGTCKQSYYTLHTAITESQNHSSLMNDDDDEEEDEKPLQERKIANDLKYKKKGINKTNCSNYYKKQCTEKTLETEQNKNISVYNLEQNLPGISEVTIKQEIINDDYNPQYSVTNKHETNVSDCNILTSKSLPVIRIFNSNRIIRPKRLLKRVSVNEVMKSLNMKTKLYTKKEDIINEKAQSNILSTGIPITHKVNSELQTSASKKQLFMKPLVEKSQNVRKDSQIRVIPEANLSLQNSSNDQAEKRTLININSKLQYLNKRVESPGIEVMKFVPVIKPVKNPITQQLNESARTDSELNTSTSLAIKANPKSLLYSKPLITLTNEPKPTSELAIESTFQNRYRKILPKGPLTDNQIQLGSSFKQSNSVKMLHTNLTNNAFINSLPVITLSKDIPIIRSVRPQPIKDRPIFVKLFQNEKSENETMITIKEELNTDEDPLKIPEMFDKSEDNENNMCDSVIKEEFEIPDELLNTEMKKFKHKDEKMNKTYACQSCGAEFIAKYAYIKHLLEKHQKVIKQVCKEDSHIEFQYEKMKNNDVKRELTNINIKETSQRTESINLRKNDKVGTKRKLSTNEREYECDYCKKIFRNKNYLRKHLYGIPISLKKVYCRHCTEVFANKCLRKIHWEEVHKLTVL